MNDERYSGGCFCRAVRWSAKGAPRHRLVCHCSSCRRTVGAHAVAWATFARDDFSFDGEPTRFESSPGVVRTFCPHCGSSLTYETDDRPGEIDLTQATLDSPSELDVTGHIWMQDAAPWEMDAHLLPRALRDEKPASPPASRPLRTWTSPKAVKGQPSSISGKGVFAIEPISKGEVVQIKGGHILEARELDELSDHLQNSEITISDGMHLAATNQHEYEHVMLYLNHSCEPNVGLNGNIVFVAMRDISAGEELTVDYAMFDDHDDEVMTCCCGSKSCRTKITGQDWRRPDLQQRYGSYFSSYLQERMKHLGST